MKQKLFAVIGLAGLLLIPTLGIGVAQEQQSGQGLEISPVLIDDQNVDPGQSLQVDIKVRNVTSQEVIAKGQINDFEAAGEDGSPKIIVDENAEPSPYSFKEWTGSIPELRLAPRETKTATIDITVPGDASPGGHYGVIRFTAVPTDIDQTGVSLSASVGTIVLLSVSGDVVTEGSLEEFTISQNGKSGTFFEYGPLNFAERVINTGNVHFKPQGSLVIKDTLGRETANLPVNVDGGNILPDSIRKFDQALDQKNLFGRYTAELNLTYGDNQTITNTTTFWVVPYKLVLAALFGLLVLILIIVLLIKRYKKHVEEKVHNEDAVKYGHEESPVQHTPGMVHHPEEDTSEPQDQQPPTDNTPKIQ